MGDHTEERQEGSPWTMATKPCAVGFGGPESEIVQRLIDDEKELKVVSVLGPGGLGKTTLAREVFKKQRSQFDCGAIVYVGRYPSLDDT
ncbi:hypothetical protein SETIT_8G239600v2 [Setaria italica]|uniref:NB-ARC domain-containing protein n=1 Tax=Setaria italica TaxID=4555 RepID=K3ZM79_SETIT|nr:hypothetical protein SETIT_8G239600v2 [Setaria italica]